MSDSLEDRFFFLKKNENGSYVFLGKEYSRKPPSWLLLSFGKNYLKAIVLLFVGFYLTSRTTIFEENFPLQFNIMMGVMALTIIFFIWKDVKNYNELQ